MITREKIVDSIDYVVNQSNYVSINKKNISSVLPLLSGIRKTSWLNSDVLDLSKLDEEQVILYFLLCESLNFCFWDSDIKWKIEYHGEWYSGSYGVFYAVARAIETGKLSLDVSCLEKLTIEDLDDIFYGTTSIPLLKERFDILQGLVQELKNVSKSFGSNVVLKDISLQIDTGEIVSILGQSGCGKTTLLNVILGLTDLTSGQIFFDGENLSNVPMKKRGFNIVFQDFALFPNLNAYENIVYGLRNNPQASTMQEVRDLIDLLDLEKHLNKRIDELSGGQKQRVAIARTLVMKPRLLLLDEPLSALDGMIKESIKARIKQIARQFNLTTVIVTHDPEEALSLSDKVLILNGGLISQYADPLSIVHKPANTFIKDFILRQLTIKRDNIFRLFNTEIAA